MLCCSSWGSLHQGYLQNSKIVELVGSVPQEPAPVLGWLIASCCSSASGQPSVVRCLGSASSRFACCFASCFAWGFSCRFACH